MRIAQGCEATAQRLIFITLAAGLVLAAAALESPTTSAQLLVSVPLIVLIGVPHGALDYLLAEAISGRRGKILSNGFFLVGYAAASLVVIMLWWLSSTLTLAAFLLASVLHFGRGDVVDVRPGSFGFALESVGRGLVVVAFPAAFHADQVIVLFAYLLPADTASVMVRAWAATAPIAGFALVMSIGRRLHMAIVRRQDGEILTSLELVGLLLLFAVSPPLLAFTVYFCALHSVRHLLQKGRCLYRQGFLLKTQVTVATALTAVTALLATLAYAALGGPDGELEALMQVVFVGLAAVTLPHMLVVAAFERRFGTNACEDMG